MTADHSQSSGDASRLHSLAQRKVREARPQLATHRREAAVELLTDIYRVGLCHGVSPDTWAAVASLAHECIDAVGQRGLAREAQQRSRNAAEHERYFGLER